MQRRPVVRDERRAVGSKRAPRAADAHVRIDRAERRQRANLPRVERDQHGRERHDEYRTVDQLPAQRRTLAPIGVCPRAFLAALLRECARDPAFAANPPTPVEPLPAALVAGRREALRRVLFNLIGNATGHAPHVWIALELDGGAVELRVDDDGPGIAPGDAARLLAPFARGGDDGARDGAGLGLHIVAQLAAAQGATFALRASERGGLAAVVTLPRV